MKRNGEQCLGLAKLPEEDIIITDDCKIKLLNGQEIDWFYIHYLLEDIQIKTEIQNEKYYNQVNVTANCNSNILDLYKLINNHLLFVILTKGSLNVLVGTEKGLKLKNFEHTNLENFSFLLESVEPESQKPYLYVDKIEEAEEHEGIAEIEFDEEIIGIHDYFER